MRMLTAAIVAAFIVTPALAADSVIPSKPHPVQLTDDQIQIIVFMAQNMGSRCDISQSGQQFCIAQIRAAGLIADLNKQINPPK